jgi:circadian clock protein KaiB
MYAGIIQKHKYEATKKNRSAQDVEYVLRLFVTGASPNSIQAIANLRAICEAHLKGWYSLEIIDVYQEKALA